MAELDLSVPRFNGRNGAEWVFKAERLFNHAGVSVLDPCRISTASILFMEPELVPWFQRLDQSIPHLTWPQLVEAVKRDFSSTQLYPGLQPEQQLILRQSELWRVGTPMDLSCPKAAVAAETFILLEDYGATEAVETEDWQFRPDSLADKESPETTPVFMADIKLEDGVHLDDSEEAVQSEKDDTPQPLDTSPAFSEVAVIAEFQDEEIGASITSSLEKWLDAFGAPDGDFQKLVDLWCACSDSEIGSFDAVNEDGAQPNVVYLDEEEDWFTNEEPVDWQFMPDSYPDVGYEEAAVFMPYPNVFAFAEDDAQFLPDFNSDSEENRDSYLSSDAVWFSDGAAGLDSKAVVAAENVLKTFVIKSAAALVLGNALCELVEGSRRAAKFDDAKDSGKMLSSSKAHQLFGEWPTGSLGNNLSLIYTLAGNSIDSFPNGSSDSRIGCYPNLYEGIEFDKCSMLRLKFLELDNYCSWDPSIRSHIAFVIYCCKKRVAELIEFRKEMNDNLLEWDPGIKSQLDAVIGYDKKFELKIGSVIVWDLEIYLELFKSTGYTSLITMTSHHTCFAWVLFLLYVIISDQGILNHAIEQLKELPLLKQRGQQERINLKSLLCGKHEIIAQNKVFEISWSLMRRFDNLDTPKHDTGKLRDTTKADVYIDSCEYGTLLLESGYLLASKFTDWKLYEKVYVWNPGIRKLMLEAFNSTELGTTDNDSSPNVSVFLVIDSLTGKMIYGQNRCGHNDLVLYFDQMLDEIPTVEVLKFAFPEIGLGRLVIWDPDILDIEYCYLDCQESNVKFMKSCSSELVLKLGPEPEMPETLQPYLCQLSSSDDVLLSVNSMKRLQVPWDPGIYASASVEAFATMADEKQRTWDLGISLNEKEEEEKIESMLTHLQSPRPNAYSLTQSTYPIYVLFRAASVRKSLSSSSL